MTNRQPILVTGGSGLLGSALVHQLVAKGSAKTIVLDLNPDPTRLDDVIDQVEYVVGDVGDPEVLHSVISKVRPSQIYHFAALLAPLCEKDPMLAIRVNVDGFMHLMEEARKNDVSQVIFSSSLGTYGLDLDDDEILTDKTLQRPTSVYGVTKLFAEGAGRFYKRKYGLDYRAIRYPAIVGPGVRASGYITYTSAMIEYSARGEPYTVDIEPYTQVPLVHVEDAARAAITLGQAPVENIKMINYLINGVQPVPTAGEMAEIVRRRIPGAQIDFQPDPERQAVLKLSARLIDDSCARQEWNWQPVYDTYEKILDSYLTTLQK
jgi:nucleoside-diphosphate-sugar epimerase